MGYWDDPKNNYRRMGLRDAEAASIEELVRAIESVESNVDCMLDTINLENRTSSQSFQNWCDELIEDCFQRLRKKLTDLQK